MLDQWRARYGEPAGLIHGAGLIKDKLIRQKTVESFDRVLETKLVRRLEPDPAGPRPNALKFTVLFSSIAGRFGNVGQSDYAAANEILNKLAHWLDRRWAGRVLSVIWGPWSGVGMVSQLESHLGRRGLGMISPDEGPALLVDELRYGRKGDVEVIVLGQAGNARGSDRARAPRPSLWRSAHEPGTPRRDRHCRPRVPVRRRPDASTFFENMVAGRDCTREVPADRWDPATFCDPASTAGDRVPKLPRRLSRLAARIRRGRARRHAAHRLRRRARAVPGPGSRQAALCGRGLAAG